MARHAEQETVGQNIYESLKRPFAICLCDKTYERSALLCSLRWGCGAFSTFIRIGRPHVDELKHWAQCFKGFTTQSFRWPKLVLVSSGMLSCSRDNLGLIADGMALTEQTRRKSIQFVSYFPFIYTFFFTSEALVHSVGGSWPTWCGTQLGYSPVI